jgi:dihydroneopterin aldolase
MTDHRRMDEVLLERMLFYGYHGVNREEQILGQRFIVDLSVSADLREAGRTDDIDQTISYSALFRRIRPIVEEERFQLLEALAEAISSAVLDDFERATGVTVTIRKPGVAIKGSILDSAGVRIRRERAGRDT